MTTRRLLILSTLLAACGTPAAAQDKKAEAPSLFRDDVYGLSMAPPTFSGRNEAPVRTVVIFTGPAVGGFASNVNLQIQEGGLDQFVKATEAQLKSMGVAVSSRNQTKVDGRRAQEYLYTAKAADRDLKFLSLAVEDGDRVILLTATALGSRFEADEKAFRDCFASLKFDKRPR